MEEQPQDFTQTTVVVTNDVVVENDLVMEDDATNGVVAELNVLVEEVVENVVVEEEGAPVDPPDFPPVVETEDNPPDSSPLVVDVGEQANDNNNDDAAAVTKNEEATNEDEDEVVCVVDKKDTLKLYCYKTCSDTDTDEIKSQRSVVKDEEGNVIATSLPFTDEYVVDDEFQAPDIPLNEYIAYPSVEGTLIRLFHHGGTWHITTNRRLDAFKSYWSCHFSFGQLFVNNVFGIYKENNLEAFSHRLNPSQIYFFLLRPTVESRIVCNVDPTQPSLYFVGTISKDNLEGPLVVDKDVLPEMSRMEPVTFNDMPELCEYVKKTDYWSHQGLILFHKEKNKQIKFIHPQYKHLWSVRNNNPNLFLRYFEIRQDSKLLEDFFKLYPKFIVIADKFETQIFEVSKYLHQAYVDRYIRKQYVSLPKQEYVVLKKAHDWHNIDRNYNRMYRHKMLNLVNEEKPIHLYQIVKRHFKY